MLSINRWLWKGSYEPSGERLPVWEGLDEAEQQADLLVRTGEFLGELGRLADLAQEMERRQGSSGEEEIRQLLKSMLPVLDALDRIQEYAVKTKEPSDEFRNWMKCVDGLAVRLLGSLEKVGLTPLSSVGLEVNLDVHDVIAMRPSREYPEGTVIEESQKGYYFRGRLLRDAKVVVALPCR